MRTESSVLEEWIPGDSVKYNYSYRYFGTNPCAISENCTCHRLNRVKGRPLDFVGQADILTFPFIESNFIYNAGGGISQVLNILESIEVGSQSFTEVAKVLNTECITENGNEVNFYFSKHYGLVKKELPLLDETWNLIEFNIIQ